MTRKLWIFLFVTSTICMGQIVPPERKSKYSLKYPFESSIQHRLLESSPTAIRISTDESKDVVINGVFVNSEDYCVEYDNIAVHKGDTLLLSKNKPVELKLYFYGNTLTKIPCFLEFSSSNPDFLENQIRLYANTFEIRTNEMREGKVELEISEFATDSVLIRFPYGGTVSSATLWKDSGRKQHDVIRRLSGYGIGSENNYVTWSTSDLGQFSGNFSSCHWFADFDLILK